MGCGASVDGKYTVTPTAQATPTEPCTTKEQVIANMLSDRHSERTSDAGNNRSNASRPSSRWSAGSGPAPLAPADMLCLTLNEAEDALKEASPEDLCLLSMLQRNTTELTDVRSEDEYETKALFAHIRQTEDIVGELLTKGVAAASRHGRHVGPSHDALLVCHARGFTVWAIAAGRGENGHLASEWVVQCAMALAISEVVNVSQFPDEACMRRIYNICNDALSAYGDHYGVDFSISGSMLSMFFLEHETLDSMTAWIGDSKILLLPSLAEREAGQDPTSSSILTSAYDPRAPWLSRRGSYEEVVSTVWMLGNFAMRMDGTDPSRPTTRRKRLSEGQCVVGCSDGIWENIEHEEVTSLILDAGPKNPSAGLDALMEAAKAHWDDVNDAADLTCVVCWV
mmetsp:Transcript_45831/g.84046  ORF Transcript_45831/g.84046 Transcript_45831/m.84046 type:complete len:397 (-) Transcript_45831:183-1373(-)